MDIFTLEHSGSTYKNGELINGLYSKQWIERYLEPGEFSFSASPTEELREKLAIGTLISHTNTEEVMIVEDHQIEEKAGSSPVFTVTGRSLDSFIESRAATDDGLGFRGKHDSGVAPLVLYDGTAWPYFFEDLTPPELAVKLLEEALEPDKAIRTAFAIPNLAVSHNITTTYTSKKRDVQRGDLAQQILDILGDIEAGIKSQRPDSSHSNLKLLIHKGVNRKDTVRFSYEKGDVLDAKYFWSSRAYRNSAYITTRFQGKYVTLGAAGGTSGLTRRVHFIDATDIEKATTWDRVAEIYDILETRAKRELRKSKRERVILEAKVSPNSQFKYREHYKIGDIVRVDGNYDISANMRVVEYAESDDGSGSIGVPTLEQVRTNDDSDLDIFDEGAERGGTDGVS